MNMQEQMCHLTPTKSNSKRKNILKTEEFDSMVRQTIQLINIVNANFTASAAKITGTAPRETETYTFVYEGALFRKSVVSVNVSGDRQDR
ncbi:hypothetical protein JTE90_005757 [Oedothorax gibbosus]|uniref:Uncharacterized protein n=1 Tax=Oedothorax gibbosus TaxID=931172 RepID=A0AAV6URV3_9ARAC|nr:hypothetical protein JTE90_005757 [Oedothorax gibbosus]